MQFTLMIEKNRTKDLLNYERLIELQTGLFQKDEAGVRLSPVKLSPLKTFLFNFGIPKSTRSLFNPDGRQSRK
ncbi:MAG: hypothetical protein JJ858_03010 [Rhizobiaceae bacterium]|nr:hypothetical protein [Rhizobiaceae bacterium]